MEILSNIKEIFFQHKIIVSIQYILLKNIYQKHLILFYFKNSFRAIPV